MIFNKSLLPFIFVFLAAGAFAEDAMLRINCEGADVDAEVYINDKFKGQCPVDLAAPAGNVKVRLVKKIDEENDGVFEKEFKLAGGTIKRVDAVLARTLNAVGREKVSQRAAAAKVAALKKEAEAYSKLPARPQLPFEVDEDVWEVLEASDYYKNLPPPRKMKVDYKTTTEINFKNKSIGRQIVTITSEKESALVAHRCRREDEQKTIDEKPYSSTVFVCGHFIGMGGNTSSNGSDWSSVIKKIKEIKGSLFPLQIGNRVEIHYESAYLPDRDFDVSHAIAYEVVGKIPAADLDSSLTGAAWKMQRSYEHLYKKDEKMDLSPKQSTGEDYYLEDLGVFLSEIAKGYVELKADAPSEVRFGFPKPGETKTTSYDSYVSVETINKWEWKVGE